MPKARKTVAPARDADEAPVPEKRYLTVRLPIDLCNDLYRYQAHFRSENGFRQGRDLGISGAVENLLRHALPKLLPKRRAT